jgi:hypothetical protein
VANAAFAELGIGSMASGCDYDRSPALSEEVVRVVETGAKDG